MTAHRGAAPLSEEPRPVVVRGCEPLYHEPAGAPRLVIVSDLPLEASVRTAMHQMTQAIKLTLKDRGSHAGRWSVGYVVCDDSGSNGHFSGARCASPINWLYGLSNPRISQATQTRLTNRVTTNPVSNPGR